MDGMPTLWDQCLEIIKSRINSQSYKTWFKGTTFYKEDAGQITILVKNKFTADWLEKHHYELIQNTLHYITDETYRVTFVYKDNTGAITPSKTDTELIKFKDSTTTTNGLNPKFTFDKFVVGDFNKFAHAAALAVSEAPGISKYNPLYIYGGVGLGKTHLIQAIGHFIIEENADKKITYVSAEKFTQDFIDSLINKKTNMFNRFYRNMDVLLIDDIQFLSGKEGIQNSFFHIFNSLHHQGKQIVLNSDREPNHISGLEDRLLSRLKWGLIVDIQPPDFESRIAILKKKIEFDGIGLPQEIINYIAQNVTKSIRDLEGALIRLLAYSSISGHPIDIPLTQRVISHYIDKTNQEANAGQVSANKIKATVAEYFSISPGSLDSPTRIKRVALARQIAMYLLRNHTEKTLQEVGNNFGGRDHSTVIHACRKIESLYQTSPELKKTIQELQARL